MLKEEKDSEICEVIFASYDVGAKTFTYDGCEEDATRDAYSIRFAGLIVHQRMLSLIVRCSPFMTDPDTGNSPSYLALNCVRTSPSESPSAAQHRSFPTSRLIQLLNLLIWTAPEVERLEFSTFKCDEKGFLQMRAIVDASHTGPACVSDRVEPPLNIS